MSAARVRNRLRPFLRNSGLLTKPSFHPHRKQFSERDILGELQALSEVANPAVLLNFRQAIRLLEELIDCAIVERLMTWVDRLSFGLLDHPNNFVELRKAEMQLE